MDLKTAKIIAQAAQKRLGYRDLTFPKQDAFVVDGSKFVVAQCSRRAGKSTGIALRFLKALAKHPGAFCPYIALTRESARNIMWAVLEELDDRFKIGLNFTESNLTVTHPNDARLQLFGADMKNFIRRLKGVKTPGAAIDECQDHGSHLQSLVDDVITPALTDYSDSWLALAGTPGPVPNGYFYEITEQRRYGFSVHKWSLFDNVYLPNAQEFVGDLKVRKGWGEDNATLRREWQNEWVLDLESLVFQYQESVNHYESLPLVERGWRHVIGVDLGYHDADAIAVIAWSEQLREAYLVEEVVTTEQGITELALCIGNLINKYNPDRIVCDTGGLGRKIAEEIQSRFRIPIVAAEKVRKSEYIELLKDAGSVSRPHPGQLKSAFPSFPAQTGQKGNQSLET